MTELQDRKRSRYHRAAVLAIGALNLSGTEGSAQVRKDGAVQNANTVLVRRATGSYSTYSYPTTITLDESLIVQPSRTDCYLCN